MPSRPRPEIAWYEELMTESMMLLLTTCFLLRKTITLPKFAGQLFRQSLNYSELEIHESLFLFWGR